MAVGKWTPLPPLYLFSVSLEKGAKAVVDNLQVHPPESGMGGAEWGSC